MGRIVIACYRPKPGRQKDLEELVIRHHEILLSESMVTDRTPVLMSAEDGTVVEIFEWISDEAIEKAHHNEQIQSLWEEFAGISDFLPIGQVPEGQQLFSEFEALKV